MAKEAPEFIEHPLPPFYRKDSRVLILGSFPSVKTREMGFFYGHPQNRFWKVLALLYKEAVPMTIAERKDFLTRHHIALWDVIYSCEIIGSSDASIRNVTPTDLAPILSGAPVRRIFVNGRTAEKMYRKYTETKIGRTALCLPSTSPANAAWSLEKLAGAWKAVPEEEGRVC